MIKVQPVVVICILKLKLFSFLAELSGDDTGTIRFFGYEDMASMIGTSRETFSRMVGELKDEGMISKTGDSQIYRFSISGRQNSD